MLLAFVPMVYFIIGQSYNITRPLTQQRIKGVVKWGSRISNAVLITGLSLLIYGMYWEYYFSTKNNSFKYFIHNMWDGYLENDEWEWENLLYLAPPVVNTLFKYALTTVLGVDFIMYELIHQRMYEIFLEKGIEGVMEYSVMKPRHFDYTPEQVAEMNSSRVERLNAFSKLIAAPTRLEEVDKAIKRKRQKQLRESAEKLSKLSFLRRMRSKFSRNGSSSLSTVSRDKEKSKHGRSFKNGDDDSSSATPSLADSSGAESSISVLSDDSKHKRKKRHRKQKKKKGKGEGEEGGGEGEDKPDEGEEKKRFR